MECPVCGNAAAEDITPDTYECKAFRCSSCGEFDIVGSVYEPATLKALEPAKRINTLARAKLHAYLGRGLINAQPYPD